MHRIPWIFLDLDVKDIKVKRIEPLSGIITGDSSEKCKYRRNNNGTESWFFRGGVAPGQWHVLGKNSSLRYSEK
jgi:hypothetical protein